MKKIYILLFVTIWGGGVFAQGDNCASAVAITPGSHITDGPSSGGGAVGVGTNADWYSFTPTCPGTMSVSVTNGGEPDWQGYIYDGGAAATCPTSGTQIVEDWANDYTISAPVVAGNTYFIEFTDDWDNLPGSFTLDFVASSNLSTPVISSVTATGANIDWTTIGTETTWEIEYGAQNFTPGSGTVSTVNTTPSSILSGLNPETTYDVYVSDPLDPCSMVMTQFTTLPLCAIPSSPSSNNPSAPGAQDVSLSWVTGASGEVMWDVEYGVSGTVLGNGTMIDNTLLGDMGTTGFLGVSGLTQLTDYHWYVRAVCDVNTTDGVDTVSYWVGPESFTTAPLCPQPTGFTATAVDTFDMQLDWTAGGLEGAWFIEYGVTGFVPGTGTTFTVSTATDTLIDGLDPMTTYDFYLTADCAANGTSPVTGPASATTGVACMPITGINTTALTVNSADLSWTAGSTEVEWNVLYGTAGFDPLTGGTVENVMTTPALSITGLDAGTSYDVYVEAVCGVDTMATWVGPFTFTTIISCPQPTNLGAMNITNTAANLIYQAGGSETSWNIEYGVAGFTPDNGEELGSAMGTTDNPYYATGLSSCGSFDYYVQAACGAGDLSAWAGPYTFNTLSGSVMAPYMQNFDGSNSTPNCWTNDGPENWIYNSAGTEGYVNGMPDHSGTGNFAWIDMDDVGTTIDNGLITPMIDLTPLANTPHVGFWILSNNDDDAAMNIVTLEAFDGTNWIEVGSYSGWNTEWVKVDFILPAGFTATSTMFKLILKRGISGGNRWNNDLLIDDFYVVDGPVCSPVEAGTAVGGSVCSNGTFDLFDGITGYVEDNGTWYYPSASTPGAQSFSSTNGTMLLTGLDEGVDYTFDYVVTNACSSDTVSMIYNWAEATVAGGDGSITTCVNHDVVLIQEITGSAQLGGTWSDDDAAGSMVNGIFSPATVTPGDYNFTYTVDNGTCSDEAVVTVTVEACLGVDANEVSTLEVYPNPVHDVLTIANLNVDGNAVITVVDVQGKVVTTTTITNVNGNYELDLSAFENGIYVIEVTSELTTQKVRVVKH